MSNSDHDQKAHAERAMQKKIDQETNEPNHPNPGQTSGKGMHPIERDKPITPDEKAAD